jgi:hypothetical protein
VQDLENLLAKRHPAGTSVENRRCRAAKGCPHWSGGSLVERQNTVVAVRMAFSEYAGGYVRRPSMAHRRITSISDQEVRLWAKDKKDQGR